LGAIADTKGAFAGNSPDSVNSYMPCSVPICSLPLAIQILTGMYMRGSTRIRTTIPELGSNSAPVAHQCVPGLSLPKWQQVKMYGEPVKIWLSNYGPVYMD